MYGSNLSCVWFNRKMETHVLVNLLEEGLYDFHLTHLNNEKT